MLSIKLQSTLWNALYLFHFIHVETEDSEKLGSKQVIHRRAGIPIHDCLIPKCCTVKWQCLSEIFLARECPDSGHLPRLYRLKYFYHQLQNLTALLPKSIQLLFLTKKTCDAAFWMGIPGINYCEGRLLRMQHLNRPEESEGVGWVFAGRAFKEEGTASTKTHSLKCYWCVWGSGTTRKRKHLEKEEK